MKNKKNILRLGTFLAILMFLLVPLLSQPVAAAFTTTSFVNTNNAPGGPIVGIIVPGGPYPIMKLDQAPRIATFQLNYSFGDTNGAGIGSNHSATLIVTRTPPPNPPGSPASTGVVFVGPNAGLGVITGTLTIIDTWPRGGGVTWDIDVVGTCQDIQTGNTQSNTDWYQVAV